MKIAMIYGELSRPNGFDDPSKLYTEVGLTGSEGSFFNLARTLSEKGHVVAVFCKTPRPVELESGLAIIPLQFLEQAMREQRPEVAIAWNEPDYLRLAPPGTLRLVDQQLNDFRYCQPGWQDAFDVLVSPSIDHGRYLIAHEGAPQGKMTCIPNSVDLDLLPKIAPTRNPHRVIYCSSPDRGLHHLLAAWPHVRANVPDAELKIFYRLESWLENTRQIPADYQEPTLRAQGRRARYIDNALARLQPGSGKFGVEIVGFVSNVRMMEELSSAAVLAYPCDPVRYTEGFGCSVLDAAAAGCVPLISTADALPSVHAKGAIAIDGKPYERMDKWVHWISKLLVEGVEKTYPDARAEMFAHARRHSRQVVAAEWETLIVQRIGPKAFLPAA